MSVRIVIVGAGNRFGMAGLTALIFFSVACEKQKTSTYGVSVRNDTAQEIRDAQVVYPDGFVTASGILVPRGQRVEGGIRRPIPDTVRVEWTDAGGVHTSDVKVSGVSADFDGTLRFVIQRPGSLR